MLKTLRDWLANALAAAANRVRTQDGPGPWRPPQQE